MKVKKSLFFFFFLFGYKQEERPPAGKMEFFQTERFLCFIAFCMHYSVIDKSG